MVEELVGKRGDEGSRGGRGGRAGRGGRGGRRGRGRGRGRGNLNKLSKHVPPLTPLCHSIYHKVREYFVYRDDHGLGSMAIHLAHHCFSFNMRI